MWRLCGRGTTVLGLNQLASCCEGQHFAGVATGRQHQRKLPAMRELNDDRVLRPDSARHRDLHQLHSMLLLLLLRLLFRGLHRCLFLPSRSLRSLTLTRLSLLLALEPQANHRPRADPAGLPIVCRADRAGLPIVPLVIAASTTAQEALHVPELAVEVCFGNRATYPPLLVPHSDMLRLGGRLPLRGRLHLLLLLLLLILLVLIYPHLLLHCLLLLPVHVLVLVLLDPILPLLPVLLTRRGAVVDIICSARQIDRFLGAGRPQGGGVTRALRRAPEELFAARQRSCC